MTDPKEIKPNRYYTKDHEWAVLDGGEVLVGITAFAVDQLGDVTLVDVTVSAGSHLDAHQNFGTIESVKTLSDLFSPISGTVTRVNQNLVDHPELVNESCWEKAWMIALKPDQALGTQGDLLDATQYASHLEQAG